jgi:hypothetical protein
MSLAGKYIKLKIIMLNEMSQTQKDKYCMYSLIYRIEGSPGKIASK